MTVQVIHKNSSVQNRPILETQLANGELGINYHESGPFVQLKDTDGEVIRVGGVVQQETQPGLGQKGAWWFKPSTKILYLHNGTTWIAIGGAGGGGGGGDVTNTSQLVNDGQNGVDPFITAQDLTTPGDGELTIRQGGVSKGTFKANQTGDAVIDLDGGGVTKLVAGTNVTLSPTSGVGDVTINASGGSGTIDLGYTAASNKGIVTNTSGTDAEIPIVDASNAGLMTPSQKTKLDDAAETGDIGNATLTVTQGGVSKGTFTANASANVTIDLDAGGGSPPGDGTISIETFDGVPVGSFSVNQTDDETIVLPESGGVQIGDPVSVLTNDAGYITDTDVGEGQISIFTTDGPVASFNVNQSADQTITIPTGGGGTQIQSDYTQADTAAVDYIKNKPDLTALATALQPGDNVSELTNDSDYLVKGSINPVLYATLAELPAAADNHGGVAHVHETGLEYYAHAGSWIALAKASDIYWQQAAGVLSPITATDVINAAGYRIDQLTTLP